jgi:cell division septation protein DedD
MSRDTRDDSPLRYRIPAALALVAATALTGCENAQMPGFLQSNDKAETASMDAGGVRGGRSVERDVEAPEVFNARDRGLWDGRPSLGGVWVAHPDVTAPERVIIRNQANGQFVIGALFKREREAPGPKFQVSSDAAAALDMLAGQPAELDVVALRREEGPADGEAGPAAAAPAPDMDTATDGALTGASEISSATLAPEAADVPQPSATPEPAPAPQPAAQPAAAAPEAASGGLRASSDLDAPYIQIGIFSVEQNALNTAEAMRQDGMVPTVKKQSSSGKTFWRVLVGPAQTEGEVAGLLKKIKANGFTDAYAVSS